MRALTALIVVVCSFVSAAVADPVQVESRIVRVGLFKNGLAVVKRIVELPKDSQGPFEVTDVPDPVHGTFWIQSNGEITTRVTSREVESPLDSMVGTDFQRELAGKRVIIHFREANLASLSGRVVEVADDDGPAWSRTYEPPSYNPWYGNPYDRGGSAMPGGAPGRYLVIENDGRRTYVDFSTVALLSVEEPADAVKRRKNLLIFTRDKNENARAGASTIAVTYLSKGMTWAPAYLVDISDAQTLALRQQAVIKNELGDVQEAELFLISGFPSVEFGHVISPLSPRTNLTQFFAQLNQRFGEGSSVVRQQAVMGNIAAPMEGADLAAAPEAEGVDLHYEPIGHHTLTEGDSIMLSVASGQAKYERIVEWIIPDTRDAYGRMIEDYRRQQEPEKFQDAVWDAVRFRNPLKFPLTTAPATIVADERFNGQRTIYWTNPGEEATLKITKALSVRTRHSEQEEEGVREVIDMSGRKLRKVPVKGELITKNQRGEPITMVIRRRFSGELIEADGSPKTQLLEEGVYSINRRNELVWTLKLNPGEEKTLAYRYSVLAYY
ncbi:MAG: DUF4139 domain-containing protein [Phycisphaerales bacterium]|nr:DUF4139 domain-containing protein [Phycisphaerales bacterium]